MEFGKKLRRIGLVLSSFLVYVINGGVFYSSGIFFPEFLHALNADRVAISWLGSLQTSICLFSGRSYNSYRSPR